MLDNPFKIAQNQPMTTQITLTLPNALASEVSRFGEMTKRDMASVLLDTLEMMWPTLPDVSDVPSVETLSDDAVIALAQSKMNATQNKRLATLQTVGKNKGLSADERKELTALLHIYQLGQLRKSEAIVEAVKRGLLPKQ